MLCLGLDPKSDLTQISSILAESECNFGPPESDQDSNHTAGQANGVSVKPRLLMAIISASKGSGQYPMTTPTLTMVLTGCHAILQFVGNREVIPGSLILSGDLMSHCSCVYCEVLCYYLVQSR